MWEGAGKKAQGCDAPWPQCWAQTTHIGSEVYRGMRGLSEFTSYGT